MNEWRQLLRQTHPKFEQPKTEENFPNPTTMISVENSGENSSFEGIVSDLVEDISESVDSTEVSLEWISPTAQLQDDIASIPSKMAFKIGEAADLVGVKQYVLRYWESEFDALKPKKSKNGQRMYARRDVETALFIKKLLHDDRFSIEGARSALKRLKKQMRDKDKIDVKAVADPVVAAPQSIVVASGTVIDQGFNLEKAEALLEAIRQAKESLGL